MRFFLGTHEPSWLAKLDVPLFLSRRRLEGRRSLPRAVAPWALDSGGFTELSLHGRWTLAATDYVRQVRRFRDDIGRLEWAAPQDWMVEPSIRTKTGLTTSEHLRRTVLNLLELRSLAPDLPFIPVLQGWTEGDYYDCWELYEQAGVDLRSEPLVGVGTFCRRQDTIRAGLILQGLCNEGLRLHGFGFKVQGLRSSGHLLASSDSLAWSLNARLNPPMAGHSHTHCGNCAEWALDWRERMLSGML